MYDTLNLPGSLPGIDPHIIDDISWKWQNVPYAGQSDQQILDIYYPEEAFLDRYPAIVYFHGGNFEAGTKSDVDLKAVLRALQRGYAVVSVEYRKSTLARFPAALYDAKAAIRFLRANARRYHIDEERIGVWGSYSGGWLVSMLGITAGNPAFEDLTMGNASCSSRVHAVLDFNGPCAGFHLMDQMAAENGFRPNRRHSTPDSAESRFMGADISLLPELCELANPCRYAGRNTPPFLIIHETANENIPFQQSVQFADALKKKAKNRDIRLCLIDDTHSLKENPWYTQEWMAEMILQFFDDTLIRSRAEQPSGAVHVPSAL